MSDKPFQKYGWEICDEVQRFASNTSETMFIPKSKYDALQAELERLKFAHTVMREALEEFAGHGSGEGSIAKVALAKADEICKGDAE